VSRYYSESLQKLPKNVNKMAKLKGKSIPEIFSMSHNYPLMDTTTINMRLTRVNSVFVYAKNCGYITVNPCYRLILNDDILPQEEREAYTVEEIQRWFDAPFYKDREQIAKHPERYWTPLFMLYNGCRPSEVLQLTMNDVFQIDSIWCISINPNPTTALVNSYTIYCIVAS
jgi:integrase